MNWDIIVITPVYVDYKIAIQLRKAIFRSFLFKLIKN